MGSRPKKKARIEESAESGSESESEGEVFQVEYFKKVRVADDGEWIYLVKWYGYDNSDDDTWEPEENIANCQRLLSTFWADLGGDDNDYFPGYECAPSQAWINRERAKFARTKPDTEKRIAVQKAKETEEEKKRGKRKQKQTQKSTVAKAAVRQKPPQNINSKNRSKESSSAVTNRVKEEINDDAAIFPKHISKKGRSTRKPTIDSNASSDSDNSVKEPTKRTKKTKKKQDSPPVSTDSESSDSNRPLIQGKRKRGSGKAVTSKVTEVKGDIKAEQLEGENFASAAGDPTSLLTPEEPVAHNEPPQPSRGNETEPSNQQGTGSLGSNLSLQAETKKKPSLPRLSSFGKPSLPKLKVPSLSKPSNQAQPRMDSPMSGGGISTKQRLTQGILRMTTPTEKVSEVSRPLPPQKSSSLSGINFKKNRGPPVKASPTITTEDMSPKNVPVYSPTDMPSSISTTTSGVASSSRQSFLDGRLRESLSRKQAMGPEPRSSTQETQDKPPISRQSVRSHSPDLQGVQLDEIEMASPEMAPTKSSTQAPKHPPPISIRPATNDQVEDFLQSVQSITDSAKMESPFTPKSPFISSQNVSKENAIWTGKIIVGTDSEDEVQTISIEGCMLLPSDPSAGEVTLQQGAMPLKVAMSYNDSKLLLTSGSFYRIEDLNGVMAACASVQEWGSLWAEEEHEARKLKKVANFLSHEKLVGFVPVSIEGNVVAMSLIHSSILTHDCLPRIELSGLKENTLIVSLYSWNLKQAEYPLDKVQKHFSDRLDNAWDRRDFKLPQGIYEAYGELGIQSSEGHESSKSTIKHAVRMLELPELLHSYLVSGGERPFALWPPVDSKAFSVSPVPQIEREMLLTLLKEYPAAIDRGDLGGEQDLSLRVIFVHVNSLSPGPGQGNIRDMPCFSEYRIKNDVRFIAYGSSDIVNPRFPDIIEEIWHIGGIVTFTANALISDPLGVSERILQIEDHEFWVCYILPAVIGMAVSIAYRDREHLIRKRIACNALQHRSCPPTEAQELVTNSDEDGIDEPVPCTCDGFAYEWLLDSIDEELISVVGAPPLQADLSQREAVIHRCVPRDGQPRKQDEWKKLSDNLLASSPSLAASDTMSHSSLSCLTPRDPFPPTSEEKYCDPFTSWILQLFDSDIRNRSETLAFCMNEFKRLCGNVPQEEWDDIINREIMKELSRMQISRGFREELRRFVIVTGNEDKNCQTVMAGLEWVTTESFKFHDVTDNDLNKFMDII